MPAITYAGGHVGRTAAGGIWRHHSVSVRRRRTGSRSVRKRKRGGFSARKSARTARDRKATKTPTSRASSPVRSRFPKTTDTVGRRRDRRPAIGRARAQRARFGVEREAFLVGRGFEGRGAGLAARGAGFAFAATCGLAAGFGSGRAFGGAGLMGGFAGAAARGATFGAGFAGFAWTTAAG